MIDLQIVICEDWEFVCCLQIANSKQWPLVGPFAFILMIFMCSRASASEGHAYFEGGGVAVGGVAANGDEFCGITVRKDLIGAVGDRILSVG